MDLRIPFVIQGLEKDLRFCWDIGFDGACLLINLFNFFVKEEKTLSILLSLCETMSTQSIRNKLCIKFSSEHLEKSRARDLSGLPLTTSELVKQNCEKWSLISEIMLPLMIFSLTLLSILSIDEKQFLCTQAGLSIQGAKLIKAL